MLHGLWNGTIIVLALLIRLERRDERPVKSAGELLSRCAVQVFQLIFAWR